MQMAELSRYVTLPDERGHFGPYGGVFVAETLMQRARRAARRSTRAIATIPRSSPSSSASSSTTSAGRRPSITRSAGRSELGGAQIWLKREDLNHTGAHKINNCIGQALLAQAHRQARA